MLIADSTQRQTLEDANVHAAAAVAVLTSDDLTNIETGLAVRDYLGDRWVGVPVVLRVFDRDLGHTVEHHFDFRHVRSTSALAAPRFVGAALGLDILGSFTVGPAAVSGREADRGPRAAGSTAWPCDLPAQTRVIALSRAADGGRLEHPPRRGPGSLPGDQAYLLGPYEELLRVLRHEHEGELGSAGVDRRWPTVVHPRAPDVRAAFTAGSPDVHLRWVRSAPGAECTLLSPVEPTDRVPPTRPKADTEDQPPVDSNMTARPHRKRRHA